LDVVVFVCTANLCRSPMAAAFLSRELARRSVPAEVRSAGLLPGGRTPPPAAVEAMASRGLDTSSHTSRQLTGEDLAAADLVVGMAREHVREAVVSSPEVWPKAFTLKELVRRGEGVGPRRPGEALPAYLRRLGEGRIRTELLGMGPADDVADPIGGPPAAYEATAAELEVLVRRLAELVWGSPAEVARNAPAPAATG
jgi:protein-tyrosine phosphatase